MTPPGELGSSETSLSGVEGPASPFSPISDANRSFRVRCNSVLSRTFFMEEEISQGRILCVIIFALGFNELVSAVSPPVHCSLYVDDLAIYITGVKPSYIVRRLQLTIDTLISWCDALGFRFSTHKAKTGLFRSKNSMVGREASPIPFVLYGSPITIGQRVKFLGLILDERLAFLPQILHLKSSCHRPLGPLR